jgi:hypothetical protein
MNPINARFRDIHLRFWILLLAIPLLFLITVPFLMVGGGQLTRFRIANATGAEVAVTSDHTKKTVHIPNGKTANIPHTVGAITVALPDGKTWVYRRLSPLDLKKTPFAAKRHYVFFGVQDGYLVRGSLTVDLVLGKDGRIYANLPDAKGLDIGELKQPNGFPVKPDEGR